MAHGADRTPASPNGRAQQACAIVDVSLHDGQKLTDFTESVLAAGRLRPRRVDVRLTVGNAGDEAAIATACAWTWMEFMKHVWRHVPSP